MSEKIYISRKCEYCHELLILLHKHKDIIQFPVIDVHTNPYPKIVTSVPCMVVDEKILPGEELFKFINYLIQKNSKQTESDNDLMPPKNIPNTNIGPMHNGNPLNLNQSSNQNNLNVPGNIQNDVNTNGMKQDIKQNNDMLPSKSNMDGPPVDDDELLPGFCVGGSCELGFCSLEDDKDISMDNMYEMLDSEGDITPQMDTGNTKSEKGKLMDDDYSRMMKERGNDLGMKMN
tara:strand:+ start:1567 stop:2262 length:696 start_codon:yes stop_codon:yes gene_type:complete